MKKIYLNDIILNILIILCCISVPICLSLFAGNDEKSVVVSVDGKVVKQLDLSEDEVFEINGVKVEIKDGTAKVTDSDCPDKLCMDMKKAKNVGDSIICVPNKVSVKIVGTGEKEADVVAG